MRNKSREAFRNEWKYLISTSEKEMLTLRLKPFLQPDPHAGEGGYYIRSLYFDDYWNSAGAEKEVWKLYLQRECTAYKRRGGENPEGGLCVPFVQFPLSMPGILHRMYLQYDAAKDHCGLRTDSLDPGCRNGKDHL